MATSATASAPTAPSGSHKLFFYLLLAGLPFCDFLQIGLVAFDAAPVMGSLGASPEEYSAVATLYAVVAITVIVLQRRLAERLGWRRQLLGASAFLALGALVCGTADGLAGFAVGRVLMALGCGSFMTTGRLLVNLIPPSPRRFTGIRFFAAGLAWGLAAGPGLAALALSGPGWRAGFLALVLPAALLAALVWTSLDDSRPVAAESSPATPVGLLALMGGSFVLLHALQRSAYDFFADAGPLWVGLLVAGAALGLLAWADGRSARPLIAWPALGQRRYLLGMAMFGLCYLVLGANNAMLPVLLQRALGLPLEVVGGYLGLGALGGVAAWIVLARLLPRSLGPTRYYVAAFGALLLCGWQLSRLAEGAEPLRSVLPALLCNGAFVITALGTTALTTFKTLQHDDAVFSHANQVKSMLGQFSIAAGIALATLCLQWRSSLRYARLSESLSAANSGLSDTLATLTQHFAATSDLAHAPQLALAEVAGQVAQEATLMATLDYFTVLAGLAAATLLVVLLLRAVRGPGLAGRRAGMH